MTEKTCPACGHTASGRFCANCGASLPGQVSCAACGNEIPAGGRFCNQCGTPTPAAAAVLSQGGGEAAGVSGTPGGREERRPASTLPWVIAALAVLALVIALILPRSGADETVTAAVPDGEVSPVAGGTPMGDPGAVDLASMTPRERADRLFNRVMQNVSSGDSTQARFFLPMALAAYEEVPDLDADGHYHMAVLHLANGDPASARARSDSILAEAPDHLFGLFTAAQSEQALGNVGAAREFYERFQSSFAAESASARREYTEHAAVMPLMKEEAAQALEGL